MHKSIKGLFWQLKKEPKDPLFINKNNISSFVKSFLSLRRIGEVMGLENFFDPKLKSFLSEKNKLKDIEKSSLYIINAVKEKQKIVIFADYDVDGATSAALLKSFLIFIGLPSENINIYVPDRIKEGYGPNKNAFQGFKDQQFDLVITVDCGIVAFGEITFAKQIGLEVIVVDHHMGKEKIPDAVSVINPNRLDDESGLGMLCGVGVVFMLCIEISKHLKSINKQELKDFLFSSLDLVAIGTICDVVPVIGVNRAIIKRGVKEIYNTKNIGLSVLINKIGNKDNIDEEYVGFKIGPMINAAGRIGDSSLGSRLFTTTNKEEAIAITDKLITYNEERKILDKNSVLLAEKESSATETNSYILCYSDLWHEGILGIVASRLKEKHQLVTMIGNKNNDIIKFSCRSNGLFDVGSIVLEAVDKNILLKGGGHYNAAGFSVEEKKMQELKDFLQEKISLTKDEQQEKVKHLFDYNIKAEAINQSLESDLSIIRPFGVKNEKPIFNINDLTINRIEIVKNDHIRLTLRCDKSGKYLKAMAFNSVKEDLGEKLLSMENERIDLICSIGFNFYNQRTYPNIIVLDVIHNKSFI